MEKNRIARRSAIGIDEALRLMLKDSRLSSGHNTARIFEAWDQASGAAQYTLKRYFRDGRLYITVSSSAVRSQLYFQKDALLEKLNALLEGDGMFIKDDPRVGFVRELILK